tara:strand:- start:92 stop:271 length:180 start_codon:yes stop_codon:yes gene_type:complete
MAKNAKAEAGSNILWDAPFDPSGLPMGKGSSNGLNGMKLKFGKTPYSAGPITSKAQRGQ